MPQEWINFYSSEGENQQTDNVSTYYGDGKDVSFTWDGTDFDVLAAADDTVIKFGDGTESFDVWVYGSAAANYLLWDASANTLSLQGGAYLEPTAITDPGDEGAIPVTVGGYVPLVTGGAETRTLAAPSYPGQELLLYLKTDQGNCVITCATGVNQTGNTRITFDTAGDIVLLKAIEVGANNRWRVVVNDGATIDTP